MAKKKTKKKIKTKGLFDHLNAVYTDQSVEYWEKLTDKECKTYSTFLINRFISMNWDYVEIVNIFQQFAGIVEGRDSYLFYSNLLPRGRQYHKYIKPRPKNDSWAVETVAKHFEVSQDEAYSYVQIYKQTAEGKERLKNLLALYGTDQKTINKAVK